MPAFVPYDERVEIALKLSYWSCVLSKNELINVHCKLQVNIYNQVYKSGFVVKEVDYEKDENYRISFGLLDGINWVYKNRINVRLPSRNYGGRRNLFV